MKRLVVGIATAIPSALALAVPLALLWAWLYGGSYAVHALLHLRGGYWTEVGRDDPGLSPSVRRALRDAPRASAGAIAWRDVRDGFAVGELTALVDGREVDRLFLARIAPAKFRFAVLNKPSGDRDLNAWMTRLGAAAVINGSYYARDGKPATPVVSGGTRLGPADYDARAGAFVATAGSTGITDLATLNWRDALADARDAMVSYPLLVSEDGANRVAPSDWLANRSFVGEDADGNIILGTTAEAFFSLDRLAAFLRDAPLRLKRALNLDGGPIACQGISLDGFERRLCGNTELQVNDGHVMKLMCIPSCRRPTMPIALAVFPK